jgi:hypothetical protein
MLLQGCNARKAHKENNDISKSYVDTKQTNLESARNTLLNETKTTKTIDTKNIEQSNSKVTKNTETTVTIEPNNDEKFSLYDFVVNGVSYKGQTSAKLTFTTKETIDSLQTVLKDKSILNTVDSIYKTIKDKRTTKEATKQNIVAKENTSSKVSDIDKKEAVTFSKTFAIGLLILIAFAALFLYVKFGGSLKFLAMFNKKSNTDSQS